MEVKLTDVKEFLAYKTVNYRLLTEKFNTWFSSNLMGTELDYDNMTNEELDEAQKAAEALCDKVAYMVDNSFNGHCDMDSIFRMLYRICEKGTKLIPDRRYHVEFYYNIRKNGYANSKRTIGGVRRIKSHFRWHRRTYVLHDEYIKELCFMLRKMDYLSINENAQMCSLFED